MPDSPNGEKAVGVNYQDRSLVFCAFFLFHFSKEREGCRADPLSAVKVGSATQADLMCKVLCVAPNPTNSPAHVPGKSRPSLQSSALLHLPVCVRALEAGSHLSVGPGSHLTPTPPSGPGRVLVNP